MEKEELIFRKRTAELAGIAYSRDVPLHTDFLTLYEQTVFQSMISTLPPVKTLMTGGYEMAERKVVCFLPSYEENDPVLPFDCVRICPANRKFAEELTHRDYLGALMNLGIEREIMGDILITEDGAFLFVMNTMSDYICEQLTTIRHTTVRAEIVSDPSMIPEPSYEEIRGSVSSVRLDSITALATRLSRGKANDLINAEKVLVNGKTELSQSYQVKEGDVISVRGIGKFRFAGALGETKKGRIMVTLLQFR